MAAKCIYVRMQGTGVDLKFAAVSHTMVPNPASTYHRFELLDGCILLYNDFGIRQVTIADSYEKLEF